jgi:hypothetical protein
MPFVTDWDPTQPTDTDLVSEGDNEIRSLKESLDERLGSIIENWPDDPLTIKAAAVPTLNGELEVVLLEGTHTTIGVGSETLIETIGIYELGEMVVLGVSIRIKRAGEADWSSRVYNLGQSAGAYTATSGASTFILQAITTVIAGSDEQLSVELLIDDGTPATDIEYQVQITLYKPPAGA